MKPEVIIRGQNVVMPDRVTAAAIHIKQGTIVRVGAYDDLSSDCEVIDAANGSIIMPGLVDTHVHVNEPGRTEWEGFRTATHAAAAGGTTTLIDLSLIHI